MKVISLIRKVDNFFDRFYRNYVNLLPVQEQEVCFAHAGQGALRGIASVVDWEKKYRIDSGDYSFRTKVSDPFYSSDSSNVSMFWEGEPISWF